MTKEEFKNLYYSTPDENLAKKLGVCAQTIRAWAKNYGFKKGCGYIYPNDKRLQRKINIS